MPLYTFQCDDCTTTDDRYLRLAEFDREQHKQKCEACGGPMTIKIGVPVLAGLDSGPEGFMRGRTENDGCADAAQRRRLERKLGRKLGNGFYVAGLAREGHPEDPEAVCYGRDDVIRKARKLGVAVRGPGINVEPRRDEATLKAEEEDYLPSPQALKATLATELEHRGGAITRKELKELTVELQHKHGQKKRPASKLKSIYPPGM